MASLKAQRERLVGFPVETMDTDFARILEMPEGDTLDFKRAVYDLGDDASKADLVKDILAMANTPRSETARIVLGVERTRDGQNVLHGVDRHLDDADMQSQIAARLSPIPAANYRTVAYDGKTFAIIEVPVSKGGPFLARTSIGKFIERDKIYFRRGSRNECAVQPAEIASIVNWHAGSTSVTLMEPPMDSDWERLVSALDEFDPQQRYVLLASPLGGLVDASLDGGLALPPWSMTVDFDPDSETAGLLGSMIGQLGERRSLHRVVKGEKPTINPEGATYWFFARGLTGRASSTAPSAWRDWKNEYGAELEVQFTRFAAAVAPRPVKCVAAWYGGYPVTFLRSAIEAALSAFRAAVAFTVCTDDPASLESVAAEYEATVIGIPLHQLASGFGTLLSTDLGQSVASTLPSRSGAPVVLAPRDRVWLEEELELLYQDTGLQRPDGRDIGRDFLRGLPVTWYELSVHHDADRDIAPKLLERVRLGVEKTRTVRMNLYHAPGAGGTTLARRVLWDVHLEHPAAILRRCHPAETAERLYRLSVQTEKTILLLVDGGEITEKSVDELYGHLRSRQIPVVILQVLRRFKSQKDGEHSLFLGAQLSGAESVRFLELFSAAAPARRAALQRSVDEDGAEGHTAFLMALQTFEEDYVGLESFVRARLAPITATQLKIVQYLAAVHYFGQRPVPAQAFGPLLGIASSRVVRLEHALPPFLNALVVEAVRGYWRTSHALVSREVLIQTFTPAGEDRKLWRYNLGSLGIELADFLAECSGDSVEMADVVQRVFILRDNSDLLGSERSATSAFAQIIEEIPAPEGKLAVLEHLVELWPEQAHLWGHLGRFYAAVLKDYDKSLDAVDRAIGLSDGRDSTVLHMKGMVLRQEAYAQMEQGQPLADIVDVVRDAADSFEEARAVSPEDEHAYISEVQMRIRILDYVQASAKQPLWQVLSETTDSFIREAVDEAEGLLDVLRRIRHGDRVSTYEQQCRAQLDSLYGKHDKALQAYDSILSRPGVYRTPIRRQLVWTYLARAGRQSGGGGGRHFKSLSQHEVDRVVQLLEANLREEPNSGRDLRLWLQAVRRSKTAPSLESVIERVGYWKASSNSLDATYYMYVLNVLRAFEGSALGREEALRYIEETRALARHRRNRTTVFEWLGPDDGIRALVHDSELGDDAGDGDTPRYQSPRLDRVPGRIVRIFGQQAGQIEVEGLPAFFVPARAGASQGRSENELRDWIIGFSYDGLQARVPE